MSTLENQEIGDAMPGLHTGGNVGGHPLSPGLGARIKARSAHEPLASPVRYMSNKTKAELPTDRVGRGTTATSHPRAGPQVFLVLSDCRAPSGRHRHPIRFFLWFRRGTLTRFLPNTGIHSWPPAGSMDVSATSGRHFSPRAVRKIPGAPQIAQRNFCFWASS